MEPDELRAAEIFRILARTDAASSSTDLATRLSISPRTVKSCMPTVRRFARERGARLTSSRGVGYWLEVDDRAALEAAVLQLDVQLAGSPDQRWSRAWQTTQLLQWILTREGDFTLGELAAASFRSASALRASLPGIREYLEGYALGLVARGTGGFGVTGAELNRRWCLVSLLASPYHHAENLYREYPTQAYRVDPELFGPLRHALLDALRAAGHPLMDENSQLLAQYLYMTLRRRAQGHPMDDHAEDRAVVRRFPAYDVAGDVLDRLGAWHDVGDDDEDERTAVAMLLLMLEDATPAACPALDDPELGPRIDELTDLVGGALDDLLHVRLWDGGRRRRQLAAALAPVAVRERFGWLGMGPSSAVLHHDRLGTSPLAEGLARHAGRALAGAGLSLGEPVTSALASKLATIVGGIRLPFTPRRVAVCTTSGLNGAAVLRERMLNAFDPRIFATIETAELYELRGRDRADFDAVVLDYPEFSYRYDWPHVRLRQAWPSPADEELMERVVHPGLGLEEALAATGLVTQVFRGFGAQSRTEIAAGLALRFGGTPDQVSRLQPIILQGLAGRVLGQSLVVVLNPRDGVREALELYELASPLTDKLGKEVTHVLCLSVDYRGQETLLRVVEEFAHRLCFDRAAMAAFQDAPTTATLARIAAPGLIGSILPTARTPAD